MVLTDNAPATDLLAKNTRLTPRGSAVRWLVLFFLAAASPGQVAAVAPLTANVRPDYSRRLDIPLLAFGAASLVGGALSSPDRTIVPPGGLDPSQIHLGIDRHVIGNRDLNANSASNWIRDASFAFPLVLSFASAPSGRRWRAPLDRALLYAETLVLAQGITQITKNAVSRPRPFTYLSAVDRPTNSEFDIETDRAFQSMSSGHATTAWCAVSFGITDHLLTRPEARKTEHAAVGFVGGVLATTTSVLRVRAGQHFPSDVTASASIGIASGVTIPLLHHYLTSDGRAVPPPRRAWLATAAGTAAGIGATLLMAALVGP